MADFDNLFDAAIARADETIRGYMGTSATMTSGEQSGAVIRGVFDDPENISYAGQGVRVEGSSPSLFVRTDDVRQLRRGDTLTIGEENFWIDRVSPDDGGSCYLWLNRGQPRGFTTIWPPPQPVCEHGSGSHSRPVDADAGLSPSDERRLVPDTYCR
ncbi:tail attachment domain protein [Escherichia coli 3-073-06_S3_C1]|nr:tail attachment domain protein [Escherichia coli 2-011-08_S3_C2]KDW69244.1 tail attachment domain protein [Escherichia coli 2-005-03_S4_C1]KDY83508.1 tail attachment domain protein [Escherichia coli 2-474-04_S3_C1]KDY85198.1 tail attachment domain protein [Escherichia coli 2-474-04_S3_C2]KDZ09614.1 tail attachment domain protein [Escherichia coli 2-474-04_S3_C3]KDZ60651.1 tail attachment domain protein [Escherichia coli 3-073-06_S3_C1]KDZ66866.1 tail attachment domain protein [Escherichia 